MRPMARTSMENMAPVRGVPKTAPKPAAIPAMRRMRRSAAFFRRNQRPMEEATLPPICTAVPSRPTEPPNRMVMMVDITISGAMRRGTTIPLSPSS